MHRNNLLLIILFTLLLLVEEDLSSITSTGLKPCKVIADVVVVFEVPPGKSEVAYEIRAFFRRLHATLNPSPSCIRLSFILTWKEVNTLVLFSCNYSRGARCVTSADNLLTILQYKFPENREFDKNNLVKAIDSATKLLFTKRLGARKGVKKVCLLILNSGPKNNVIPTEDAVKDLHDQGVVVIAVGIKDGEKEKLDEIVLYRQYSMEVASIKALSSPAVLEELENLVIQPYEDISESDSAKVGNSGPFEKGLPDLSLVMPEDQKESCTYIVDIGFLVDSSGSVRRYYGKEKFFVQRIAAKFNISEAGSHGGVIIFSARNYVKTIIHFNNYTNLKDFNNAVEHIPYYGYLTRIDLALDKAHEVLFTLKEGARPNVRKVLFLITDGRQNPDFIDGVSLDPSPHAYPLHKAGVNIFAVGVGEKINLTELALITGSKDRVYTVKNFYDLISDDFVKNVSERMCLEANLVNNETTGEGSINPTRPPITSTERSSTKTTHSGTEQPSSTTISQTLSPSSDPCKTTCASCAGCGGSCCNKKPDVYINVFSGSNNYNYLSQGMKVTQDGNNEAKSAVHFPKSSDSGGTVEKDTKDMSTEEISTLIRECIPYQKKMKKGIAELLRRSLKTQTYNQIMRQIKKKRK